jgi:foldase protein PrsA
MRDGGGVTAVLDRADRLLWWLGAHRRAAVGGLLALAVVVVAAVLLVGRGAGAPPIPASAVAVVGSQPVATASLAHWQSAYLHAQTGTGKPTAAQARSSAFQLLVLSAWLEQEARAQGVRVTPAQVGQGVARMLAQFTGDTRQQALAQLGTTEPDLRVQERVALLAAALEAKVRGRVPAPAAQAIAAAYRREPARWARPSKRDVRVVLTADAAGAAAAAKALSAGTPFATVSSRYTTDAQLAKDGGALKGLQPGTNEPAFERAVFTAPRGRLQGPVRLKRGWAVFKVQRVTPLPARSLAAATPAIRKDLAAAAQQRAVDTYLNRLRTRWRAKTRCRPAVRDPQYCGA